MVILALHAAAAYANVDVIKCLLEYKPDANAKNTNGETALHYLVRRAIFKDDFEWSNPEAAGSLGSTGGVAGYLKLLMAAGADASISDANGHSALDAAVLLGKPSVIACILEFSRTSNCAWALPPESVAKAESVFKRIAAEGEDGDLQYYRYGQYGTDYALFMVVKGGASELLRALQEGDETASMLLSSPRALHDAIWARRTNLIALLLAAGARVDEENYRGRDARDLAKLLGDQKIIDLLEGAWREVCVLEKPASHWQRIFAETRRP